MGSRCLLGSGGLLSIFMAVPKDHRSCGDGTQLVLLPFAKVLVSDVWYGVVPKTLASSITCLCRAVICSRKLSFSGHRSLFHRTLLHRRNRRGLTRAVDIDPDQPLSVA